MMRIIRLLMLGMTVCCAMAVARADDNTFSVATLNVDGLPGKILWVSCNPDGPGEDGTYKISQYLARKGYDIIGVQEDFNYDAELCDRLLDDYDFGFWQGGIHASSLSLFDIQFDTDGLRMFWRKEHEEHSEVAVAWNDGMGRFEHSWDELVIKGFRRCELTLKGGQNIVVYNMHMDASDDEDELNGDDWPDKDARWNQWRQLRDYVMERLDERPVIVMGDMNSLYGRDSVKAIFIDAINSTLRYQVKDAWVEYCHQGLYPEIGTYDPHYPDTQGETLDKILFINPMEGRNISLQSFKLETDYVGADGRVLGDHWPVTATFGFVEASSVGVDTMEPETPVAYYSADGYQQSGLQRGLNIVRMSNGQVRKIIVK